jgi:hypothetical protein
MVRKRKALCMRRRFFNVIAGTETFEDEEDTELPSLVAAGSSSQGRPRSDECPTLEGWDTSGRSINICGEAKCPDESSVQDAMVRRE